MSVARTLVKAALAVSAFCHRCRAFHSLYLSFSVFGVLLFSLSIYISLSIPLPLFVLLANDSSLHVCLCLVLPLSTAFETWTSRERHAKKADENRLARDSDGMAVQVSTGHLESFTLGASLSRGPPTSDGSASPHHTVQNSSLPTKPTANLFPVQGF